MPDSREAGIVRSKHTVFHRTMRQSLGSGRWRGNAVARMSGR
ncbi:hypothetical protein AAKU64_004101 [Undibacterium sp. GrIS 1.8]